MIQNDENDNLHEEREGEGGKSIFIKVWRLKKSENLWDNP